MQLKESEDKLIGKWVFENGSISKDETTKRIEWLINNYLTKIGIDASGWDTLYIDSNDGRLWELLYLESEFHGGGAPSLLCISKENALKKYSQASAIIRLDK